MAALWDELHTKQPWRNAVAASPGAKPIQPFPQDASAAASRGSEWGRCCCCCCLVFRVVDVFVLGAQWLAFNINLAAHQHRLQPAWCRPAPRSQAVEVEDAKQRGGKSRLLLYIGINSVCARLLFDGWALK